MGDVISITKPDAMATLIAAAEQAKEHPELKCVVLLFDEPANLYCSYSESVSYPDAHYALTLAAQWQLGADEC